MTKHTAEDIVQVEIAKVAESAAWRTAHTGMTELVVTGALVLVAQYAIGFGRFLELLFRFLIARILVGVVLDSQFTVGFLDFGFAGRLLYA